MKRIEPTPEPTSMDVMKEILTKASESRPSFTEETIIREWAECAGVPCIDIFLNDGRIIQIMVREGFV